MLRQLTVSITITLCLSGCLDIHLDDEVNWPDGDPEGGDGSPADGGLHRPDGGAPPEGGGGDAGWSSPDGDLPWDDPTSDITAPWFVSAAGCAPSEAVVGSLCLSAGPLGIALRFWASEPVIASARLEGTEISVRAEQISTDQRLLLIPLASEQTYELVVEVEDGASLMATEGPYSVQTASLFATVVINEVLLDPLGPEPQQEFVELYNYGDDAVILDGWSIADESSEDLLQCPAPLTPGGYALIVAAGFVPGEGGDPPPGPGALMIGLESAIGTAGIRNSGESLTLRDAEGRLVSLFPAPARAPGAGVSVERREPLAPDGDPLNWAENPSEGATPARQNEAR